MSVITFERHDCVKRRQYSSRTTRDLPPTRNPPSAMVFNDLRRDGVVLTECGTSRRRGKKSRHDEDQGNASDSEPALSLCSLFHSRPCNTCSGPDPQAASKPDAVARPLHGAGCEQRPGDRARRGSRSGTQGVRATLEPRRRQPRRQARGRRVSRSTPESGLEAGRAAEQLEKRFKNLDRNEDGKLDRQEFQGGPARFSQLDRNGDGFLSRDEIPWLNPNAATGKTAPKKLKPQG